MVRFMNKKLETLIDSVPTWPQEAQDEAVRALSVGDLKEELRVILGRGGLRDRREIGARERDQLRRGGTLPQVLNVGVPFRLVFLSLVLLFLGRGRQRLGRLAAVAIESDRFEA